MVKTIIDVRNPAIDQRARYVFSQIALILRLKLKNSFNREDLQGDDIIIYYGEKVEFVPPVPNKVIYIKSFESIEKLTHKKGHGIPAISGMVNYKGFKVPFWYHYYEVGNVNIRLKYESGGCAVGEKNNVTYIGFDLIMSIFHLLSCQEEYLIPKRDKFNRFLGQYSPRYPHFLGEPIVNYYLLILQETIFNGSPRRFTSSSPPFRVVLSHDVDVISNKDLFLILGKILKILLATAKLDAKNAIQKTRSLLIKMSSSQNTYFNFEKYMEIERQFNIHSTFYFIGGKKGFHGARYNWAEIKDTMKNVSINGWGIGLHINFHDYDNWQNIKNTKQILEDLLGIPIVGGRNHYVRFTVPGSWEALHMAGIQYDTTLGYPDCPGFRAGIASPFYPYNLLTEQVVNIIEIPLVIMDTTLFRYLRLSKQEAIKRIIDLIKKVIRVNGLITILWHNRVLDDVDFPGWGETYMEVLKYILSRGGEVITEKDVIKTMDLTK